MPPAVGLRERNKAKRRNAVLDAALEMLDDPEMVALTTEQIAERAELSVATVYNLVGTREQLLLALIDRLIADLMSSSAVNAPVDDPVASLRDLISGSVEALTTRPTAYRRVVLQLTAAANGDLHTKLSPARAGSEEFRRAQAAGLVRHDLEPDALALQVYLSYNGALLRWAAGALTDISFKAAALHGLAVVLAASATPQTRASFDDDLQTLGAHLLR